MVYLWGFYTVLLWIWVFKSIHTIKTGGSVGFPTPLGFPLAEFAGREALLTMIWLFPLTPLTTLHFLWLATESETVEEYREIALFVCCIWLLLGYLIYLIVRFMRYLGLNI